MGHKVHPIGFRLGIVKDWRSRWFATKGYAGLVLEDAAIRHYFKERFLRGDGGRGRRDRGREAGIGAIDVERAANNVRITLHTAKPGIIIGRGGKGVDDLRADLERLTKRKVHINVQEIRQSELDAQLVAENVASQIEKRVSFKRTVHQAVQRSMRMGAQGIKVACSGRLGGSEMARTYKDKAGKVPLHTLRADIDYGFTEARTPAGHIGIKVWVYRGDILPEKAPARPEAAPEKREVKKRPGWRRVPAAAGAPAEPEAPAPAREPSAPPAAEADASPQVKAAEQAELSPQDQGEDHDQTNASAGVEGVTSEDEPVSGDESSGEEADEER